MIKNILLDLDDTIFDFHKAERIALKKTFASLGIEANDAALDRYSEINEWHWKQLELKKMTRNEVLFKRFEVFLGEHGIDTEPWRVQHLYEHNLGIGHYYMDGAEETLKKLYGRYRLYMVSNGTACVQYSRIESACIEKYFEKLFISQEVGFEKPDVRFFEAVFESIPDFKREETVIIGDSLSSDIKGGINAGIETVWYNARNKVNKTLDEPEEKRIVPDHEIHSWDEIDVIIQQ